MRLVAGLSDGRVWMADLNSGQRLTIREPTGAPVSALAISPDGAVAVFGDEAGEAGLAQLGL